MLNEVIRGDTLILDIEITDSEGFKFDLSNSTVIFTVKSNIDDTDEKAIIQIRQNSHTSDIGRTVITVPANKTSNLLAGKVYYWDIQVVKDELVATVAYGTFKVKADVTRSIQ